jgi:hypothetical protein
MAYKRYDELQALNKLDNFYDYEKLFGGIWQELGKTVFTYTLQSHCFHVKRCKINRPINLYSIKSFLGLVLFTLLYSRPFINSTCIRERKLAVYQSPIKSINRWTASEPLLC